MPLKPLKMIMTGPAQIIRPTPQKHTQRGINNEHVYVSTSCLPPPPMAPHQIFKERPRVKNYQQHPARRCLMSCRYHTDEENTPPSPLVIPPLMSGWRPQGVGGS